MTFNIKFDPTKKLTFHGRSVYDYLMSDEHDSHDDHVNDNDDRIVLDRRHGMLVVRPIESDDVEYMEDQGYDCYTLGGRTYIVLQ